MLCSCLQCECSFLLYQSWQIWLKSIHGPIEVFLCPEDKESSQEPLSSGFSIDGHQAFGDVVVKEDPDSELQIFIGFF
jgi:hypothetical protein